MAGPIVRSAGTGEPLAVVGEQIEVLASGGDTGSYEIFLQTAPEGAGPPPHSHPWDEAFYVLSGEFEFTIAGEPRAAPAGTFVHLPAGTVHSFAGRAPSSAMLSITSREGAARFFRDLDAAGRAGPMTLERLVEVAAPHQVRPALG